jgi:hypothetical protein
MQRPIQSTVTPSPRRRLRAAYALLTIPVALATLMALGPAKAATTAQLVTRSSVSKIFPASTIGTAGTRVQLFQVKIYPGSYHIEMPVTVEHLNADSIDYVDVSLVCKDNYGHADQMGQAVNTLHGTSFTLKPRLYITFTGTMRGVCVGYAQETRQAGASVVSPSTRALLITSAKLIVTPTSSTARETVRFKYDSSANGHPYVGHSSRASTGVHFHAGPVNFVSYPSATHSFAMTGNVFLTSCTTTGGSRDATTGGKNLCISSVVKRGGLGPLVRTRLVARQYKPDGVTPCRLVVVPNTTSTFHISPYRHHLPVTLQGTLTLPAVAGCGPHVTAWTEVYVESAPSVVVHFPSTATSVLPL